MSDDMEGTLDWPDGCTVTVTEPLLEDTPLLADGSPVVDPGGPVERGDPPG